MPNWKKIVSSANAKKFAWPAGWETRDKIAEQLDCSPERVADVLGPALKAGHVERGSFPVWDAQTQRKVLVTGYREVAKAAPAPTAAAEIAVGARVLSRNNTPGEITGVLGQKISITWDNGRKSVSTRAAFAKRDIKLA